MLRWIAAAILLFVVGCSHEIHAKYPLDPRELAVDPATIVLRFTHEVSDVYVSVNGVMIAEGARTEKIVVDGVPPGSTMIMVAGDGIEKAFVLDLEPGQRAVVPLQVVDVSFGKTILQALLSAAVYAAYLGIAAAL